MGADGGHRICRNIPGRGSDEERDHFAGQEARVGFTRGVFYAGARTIISSLWQVDDRATSELMKAFYLGLKTGKKNASLRQAQLNLKRDPRTAHPFYWAAFQMTGLE